MNLQKKVALITGGASGIGLACAKEFLTNGIKGVALVDVNEEEGCGVEKELNGMFPTQKTIFIKADVSCKESLRSAFQKTVDTFGNLDIVLNNAGLINEVEPINCYKVNIIGVMNCIELAMEEFLLKYKINDGYVINTSSIVTLEARKWPAIPIYTSSKMAILGLTMTLGHEYHYNRTGVKVMATCPGTTKTKITKQIRPERVVHFDEMKKNGAQSTGPVQEAGEYAKCVMEILDQGKNGSIWKIEGGKKEEVTTFN